MAPSNAAVLTMTCFATESDGSKGNATLANRTSVKAAATSMRTLTYPCRCLRAQGARCFERQRVLCQFSAATRVGNGAAKWLSFIGSGMNAALNKCFPISSPFSFAYRIWNLILTVLVVYLTFALPYEVATYWQRVDPIYHRASVGIDVIFAVDILVSFRIAVVLRAEQKVVYNSKVVALHYMKTWFLFDLFAVVPWDVVIGSPTEGFSAGLSLYGVYRLPRLVRLGKAVRVFQSMSSYIGVVLSLFSLMTFTHLMACMLTLALKPCDDRIGNIRQECVDASSASVIYREALYVALSFGTGATGGTSSLIRKNVEEGRWNTACDFVCAVMTFCSLVFVAWIFANYATYLQQNNKRGRAHADKLATVNGECKVYAVPSTLWMMILGYYDFFYTHKEDAMTLAHDGNLPVNLQRQLAYHLFGSFVDTVPLFARLDARSRMKICTHMYPVVFLPGDRIISRGDLGHKMYFIQNGTVVVVNDQSDPPVELAKLHAGEYFGELAIIYPMLRRTTTIIAVSLSKLLCIEDSAFADIEHFIEYIQEEAENRLKKQVSHSDGTTKNNPDNNGSSKDVSRVEDSNEKSVRSVDNQAFAAYGDLKVGKHLIMHSLDYTVSTRLFLLQRKSGRVMRSDLARMLDQVGEVVRGMARRRGIDVVIDEGIDGANGTGVGKNKEIDITKNKEIDIAKDKEIDVLAKNGKAENEGKEDGCAKK
eukprot:GEMP01010531.1.p1 GENE.GEMP01010531.1~~GEMP01010531.1.p1  ORF type:complete len:707 (+),score=127.37 GEMP01010531.1:70-2190(+)